MLHSGDILPHFEVTDFYGRRIDYSSIWQRKNLVLVMLSGVSFGILLLLRPVEGAVAALWVIASYSVAWGGC